MSTVTPSVIPAASAERSEAEAIYDFEYSATPSTKAALGMAFLRCGGGVALSVRNDPTEFWSKALGFGFDTPITLELVEEVLGFYRSQRNPVAVLQLAPSVLPEDWSEICAKTGLTAGSAVVKLARDLHEPAPGHGEALAAGLRVGAVGQPDAEEWAKLLLGVFGMPADALSGLVMSSVGRAGWHPQGVWDGDELVAVGTVHVGGDTAQMFAGATAPAARGKGAQTALIAARAKVAEAAGCRWLVAETSMEAPGEHNSSLHNLLRSGFRVAYEQTNWQLRLNP